MKKLLIFVLALGLLISATGMAMALDKDKASLTFGHNQKDIVWVSMSKVNPFDVIEENDVINGYKQWGYLAKMHVNSGAQYMVGADLTALKVPTNYQIVKGDHTQFLNSSTYNTPEKQFEHRMVIRTRKNTTRPLAACVLDAQLINSAEDYYDNGGNWSLTAAGINSTGSHSEFINGEWTGNPGSPLSGSGYVGIDGWNPLVAAGPSTNGTSGDNFKVDMGLRMFEGDHIASGVYRIKLTMIAMELVPGTSNTATDIQTALY